MMEHDSKDIEFALFILNHPESTIEERVQVWLEENEHRDLLEELRRFREAGLLETGKAFPNVEMQWHRFNAKMMLPRKGGRRIRKTMMTVAAIAVIAIITGVVIKLYQESVEREIFPIAQSHNKISAIKLISSKGEEIVIGPDVMKGNTLTETGNVIIDTVDGRKSIQILQDDNERDDEFYTLQIPKGGEYMVILSDGSRVWLNSESEMRYPAVFGKNERRVSLKGEGYFEVKRDEDRPFIVETKELVTKVLGTEFNIQNYPSCVENVTLVKGSIAVRAGGKENMNAVVLKPGENVALLGDELHVEEVDVLKYIAWKEGYFYYDDVRLEDILKELGRWFDLNVFYQHSDAKDFRFKFWSDRKETAREMLQRLEDTGRVKAELNGKNVTISFLR